MSARVLFVTNGHGEAAIAERIALELLTFAPAARIDHLALVGNVSSDAMRAVGPRRAMPSGGLIAMGNVRNLAKDLSAGLLSLTLSQARFLRRARGAYDVVVAVGDAFALIMTLLVRARTVFVGTAKSVRVAPYGPFETNLLRRAVACFVRDEATAEALRRRGVDAQVANAIVDLFAGPADPAVEATVAGFAPALALFPGSRESAYDDAAFLLEVTRELALQYPTLGAVISVAPGLDADRIARDAACAGWDVHATADAAAPFAMSRGGREIVRGWRKGLGPLLERVVLVLGQAGTANEVAAAAGVPVVAFESDRVRKASWYRRRQQDLLGEALAVLPEERNAAVTGVREILEDAQRRTRMAAVGRAQMGEAGGAARIGACIALLAAGK
jgi:uncharacterized protein (TIGR03492 family)